MLKIEILDQYQTASRAKLGGRTLTGLQLSGVLRTLREASTNPAIDTTPIKIYDRGNEGVVALHAAYRTPQVSSLAVEAMPRGYLPITQARLRPGLVDIIVPGVLKDFDLPDLAAIAPRPVYIAGTCNPAGIPLMADTVVKTYPKAIVQYRPEGWVFRKDNQDWLH